MKASRHLNAILTRVARDFICVTAEALGAAVAVTYRELIVARARLLRRPQLYRYRLADVTSVRLRRGHGISFLIVELDLGEPTTVTLLCANGSAAAFDEIAAALESRCGRLVSRRPRQLLRTSTPGLRRYATRQSR